MTSRFLLKWSTIVGAARRIGPLVVLTGVFVGLAGCGDMLTGPRVAPGLSTAVVPGALAAALAAPEPCVQHIGLLTLDGTRFDGYGSLTNGCGVGQVTSDLKIQQLRVFGRWETLASTQINSWGFDVHIQYDCAGTGTHTFRVLHTLSGKPDKISNQIRHNCGG